MSTSYRWLLCTAAYLAFAKTLPAAPDTLPARPNILWLVAEDIGPMLPMFGDSTVETPNLSRLAARGVRYPNAFVTAPVCAVSRAAIATGLYATSFGAQHMRNQHASADMERLGLPAYLAVPPPEVKMLSQRLRERGYFTTNAAKTDYQFQAPRAAWSEQDIRGHWRHRRGGDPFFSVFNFEITHESQVWGTRLIQLRYRPGFEDDTSSIAHWREFHPDGLMPLQVPRDLEVPVPPYLAETETTRRDIRRVYSNIAALDEQVGVVLDQLDADGLTGSTIVVFYSDHGGPLPRQKRLLYDSGLRIPFVIAYPDGYRAGEVDSSLLSMIDLVPSTLALAGAEVPEYLPGRVRFGESPQPPRDYAYATADRFDDQYDYIRAVTDGRFKYLRNYRPDDGYYLPVPYREQMGAMRDLLRLRDNEALSAEQAQWFRASKPREELFDTEADPHELVNLAGDPRYASRLSRMRQALAEWRERTGDLGDLPEEQLIGYLWAGADTVAQTAAPVVSRLANDQVALASATEGATVSYRLLPRDAGAKGWRLYTEPVRVPAGQRLAAVAQRIGYRESPEVTLVP